MATKYGIFLLFTLIILGLSSGGKVYKFKSDKFDWNLFNKIAETKQDENLIISPISVKFVLKLLEVAAVGRTKDQLFAALADLQRESGKESWYTEVLNSLERRNKNYELNIGTKLYFEKGTNGPTEEFSKIANESFHTSLQGVDFRDAVKTTRIINNWISDITKGKIKNMVKVDDVAQSHVILANAIYFKGKWQSEFHKLATKKIKFTLSNGKDVIVPTMKQLESFSFLETNAFGQGTKLLRMPFKGGKFAMTFILPKEINGLDNVLASITPGKISVLQNAYKRVRVKVHLPKFEFNNRVKLNKPIKNLNVTDIFSPLSNLPGLGSKFWIDKILQEAGIKLTESGTEVYAATVAHGGRSGIIPPKGKIHEFIADHPFAFFIEDESTGALLFIGKVTNPSKK